MSNENKMAIINQNSKKFKATNLEGFLQFGLEVLILILGVTLAQHDSLAIWFIGEIVLTLSMWHWFSVVHSCGHQAYFKNSKLNDLGGLIGSLFSGIPYYPWKRIHYLHHKWNGWRQADPTAGNITPDMMKPGFIKMVDFCWKYWVPLFGLSFMITTFFNVSKANEYAPNRKFRLLNLLSIFLVLGFHLGMAILFPSAYLKTVPLSFFFFCCTADIILLSQHAHINHKDHQETPVPLSPLQQDAHTRTVIFPKWVSKWVFANFNLHTIHHIKPGLPHYHLTEIPFKASLEVSWKEWLFKSKAMKGHQLLFMGPQQTGQRF